MFIFLRDDTRGDARRGLLPLVWIYESIGKPRLPYATVGLGKNCKKMIEATLKKIRGVEFSEPTRAARSTPDSWSKGSLYRTAL